MIAGLQRLADMRRQYGTGAALKWAVDRLARRAFGAMTVRVVWLEADRLPEWVRPDPALDLRFLDAREVRGFASDPENDLDPGMAQRIEGGSDLCFAVLSEGRLATYGWYALNAIEAEHAMGVAMSFPPDVAYMYKGFTHPNFRGRRLHALAMGLALQGLAERGVSKLLSVVESTNWASRRSCTRLGYVDLGLRLSIGRGGGWLLWSPKAARLLGVRFGRRARPRASRRELGPIQARLPLDAGLEVAQKAADHVPTIGAAELDVPLAVDADKAFVPHPDLGEFLGTGARVLGQVEQPLAGHLDELHIARLHDPLS